MYYSYICISSSYRKYRGIITASICDFLSPVTFAPLWLWWYIWNRVWYFACEHCHLYLPCQPQHALWLSVLLDVGTSAILTDSCYSGSETGFQSCKSSSYSSFIQQCLLYSTSPPLYFSFLPQLMVPSSMRLIEFLVCSLYMLQVQPRTSTLHTVLTVPPGL